MNSQCDRLLKALRRRPMTTRQIEDRLGIGRPASRVDELRQAGYDIETTLVPVVNRYGERARVARYSLAKAGHKRRAA